MLGHGAFTDRKESENRLFSVIHRLLGDSLPCRLKHRLNSFVSFLDTLTHHPSSFSLWSTSTSSLNAASAVTKHTFHIENQWHSGVNVKPTNRLERVPSPPAVTFWSQNNTKPKIKKKQRNGAGRLSAFPPTFLSHFCFLRCNIYLNLKKQQYTFLIM